jgi:hypothetical protein
VKMTDEARGVALGEISTFNSKAYEVLLKNQPGF